MSNFDGRNVVLTLRKDFILNVWAKIHTKLSNLTTDSVSSIQFEIQVILEEMDGKGVVDIEIPEPFFKAKEHLDLILTKKGEKVEELSITSQSLKEAKEKVKQLRALRDAAKKEVEEIESRVSPAEEEYRRCSDVSLVTVDALADVETKKQYLEVTLKDLVNYKLYLD
ncbi:hypothetical protein A4A49_51516 [Nicotiana attenuata]|uniref:Uncharacterized protein n=1 Tax=Nicotiana attenuata TaxID=49451 RepID=A0A314LDY8_NICAT|nr:hypothetical protein A4A49_51516 [Nicotiana attenuata]